MEKKFQNKILKTKDEPKKEEAVNEEVTLDLGDELEIEIEE